MHTIFTILQIGAGLLLPVSAIWAADSPRSGWPTHRHRNDRNAYVNTLIDATTLRLDWEHRSGQRPRPAWHGPAKWDAYSNLPGLQSMRNYDSVNHAVADERFVYFGSSADGTVTCLEKLTGAVRWKFATAGPVRIPPTAAGGRVYFGSDDGFAYSVDASSGREVWKFRPRAADRLILNNGVPIPAWPIRTGVTVEDGIAYFAASLLPWQESYLCAVDALTGKAEGRGTFVRELNGQTLEGALAVTSKFLLAPQGRVPPVVFQRESGDTIGSLPGGGGSFVVVTPDQQILYGPGNKTGWIEQADAESREKIATHNNGKSMVVAGGVMYMLTNDYLAALDYRKRTRLWATQADGLSELIVVGDLVLAGGRDEVVAFGTVDGMPVWSHPVEGQASGLAYDGTHLLVATDEGILYAFTARPSTAPTAAPGELNRPSGGDTTRRTQPERARDGPLGHWVFETDQIRQLKCVDRAGTATVLLEGSAENSGEDDFPALEFDGRTTIATIAADYSATAQPETAFTALAWVRVDRSQPWGGILGTLQDNGDDEYGWLLGFVNDRFCLAVASEHGPPKLTYLQAEQPFETGVWYHVAGVYDGQTMRLLINGEPAATSDEQQGPLRFPPQAAYMIGSYKDADEFYPLLGAIHEVQLFDRALSDARIATAWRKESRNVPPPRPPVAPLEYAEVAIGPWLTFNSPSTATVRWKTAAPCPTRLALTLDGQRSALHETAVETTSHEVELQNLKHNRTYHYTIEWPGPNGPQQTEPYECDTFFNYSPTQSGPENIAPQDSELVRFATAAVDRSGRNRGVCVVFADDDRLARAIFAISELQVILCHAADDLGDPQLAVDRISRLHAPDRGHLLLTRRSANLVIYPAEVADRDSAAERAAVLDLLAPGGVAVIAPEIGRSDRVPSANETMKELAAKFKQLGAEPRREPILDASMLVVHGQQIPGSGEWGHIYGRPDNSAYGGEELGGAKTIDELTVQWIGRPGPRYQADRNGRKPPPLSTAGRLYLQGLRRIVTLDIYNGSVLWSLELPGFMRFNVPRDTANWCADRDHVFAAVRDRCWKIDAATGQVQAHFPIPDVGTKQPVDWGYVARVGRQLLGTAVRKGTSHTNFFGGSGWYDAADGDAAYPVCSDAIFAIAEDSGEPLWQYRRGVILNPTITAAADRLFFVECRNATVLAAAERRVGLEELWSEQFLVALDPATGEKLWEHEIATAKGQPLFQMAYASDRLVVVASSNVEYEVSSFAADDGEQQWQTKFPWGKGKADHGSHLSRPAIVGNRVFVRPAVLELDSGKRLPQEIPVGGCGTYACSSAALLFRSGSGGQMSMWETESGRYTQWPRLRPDCWLSTIPAGGMLLSPEGGGGCSCGKWLETSVGFIPKASLKQSQIRSE